MSDGYRVGVLISGAGTNLQALIDHVHGRDAELAAVGSNRADAPGLVRAERAGIPARVFDLAAFEDRAARDDAMADWLQGREVQLVVLAGYMHLLTPGFLRRFPDRVVNVHPSLLPAFPGRTPVADTLRAGVRETGVTVHLVDDGVDSGPILLQERAAVDYDDSEETLRERLHAVEHRLLCEAVRHFAQGRLP